MSHEGRMKRRDPRPRHPFAGKLSLDDAVQIRARYAAGTSARELAAEYGVAPASVHAVLRGEAHACVIKICMTDRAYEELAVAATSAGRLVPELATDLVARWLSSMKGAAQ